MYQEISIKLAYISRMKLSSNNLERIMLQILNQIRLT